MRRTTASPLMFPTLGSGETSKCILASNHCSCRSLLGRKDHLVSVLPTGRRWESQHEMISGDLYNQSIGGQTLGDYHCYFHSHWSGFSQCLPRALGPCIGPCWPLPREWRPLSKSVSPKKCVCVPSRMCKAIHWEWRKKRLKFLFTYFKIQK